MTSVRDIRVGAVLYTLGRDSVRALWIAPDGAREHVEVAKTRELIPRLDRLRHELRDSTAVASGRVPALREFSTVWGRQLLPPAMLASPADVVVVVPNSRLHDVPLHLVQAAPDGGPIGCAVGFTYASSVSSFVRAAERNPARTGRLEQWTVAGPDAQPATNATADRSFLGGGFDALLGRNEAFEAIPSSVGKRFSRKVPIAGHGVFPPTRVAVKQAIRRDPDVLCLVAHGYVNPQDHEFSGLLLAQDQNLLRRWITLPSGRSLEFRDLPLADVPLPIRTFGPAELLTAAELDIDIQISAHLVVLLACSAGAGQLLPGDVPASLAESFLHSGAASVIAAGWDADFAFTQRWTDAFFDGWVDAHLPKALAVRQAMRVMQEASGGDHPERLGAMSLRGDWL